MKPSVIQSKAIVAKRAPEPVGPYPHARRVGDFIFVSGMGPRKVGEALIPGTKLNELGEVVFHDIEVQTEATIANIACVLQEAGASLEDVVDVTVFLIDMKQHFGKFNGIYAKHFSKAGPTRTTVEVRALPTPICVELKVIAYKPC